MKDGGLSFETQLKIEFLPPNNSSKKCLEKSLHEFSNHWSPLQHIFVEIDWKNKTWKMFLGCQSLGAQSLPEFYILNH